MRYLLSLAGWLLAAFTLFIPTEIPAQGSPGDTIGLTQYDYQCNFPTGQRIAVDNAGGIHLVWSASDAFPERHPSYVYIEPNGTKHGYDLEPFGYSQIAVNSQNQPGIVFNNDAFVVYWTPAEQFNIAMGGLWPGVSIDRQDHIHVIYCMPTYKVTYTRSENDGTTWSTPAEADTIDVASYMITSSHFSNKTAIIYVHQNADEPAYNLMYIESFDGQNWDWESGKQIVPPLAQGMYLCGFDFDAVYDRADNLNIVFNNQRGYPMGPPDSIFLCNYNTSMQQVSLISRWYGFPDSCEFGGWGNAVCKMSIGASLEWNLLAVTYTKFSQDDCSRNGYANGEIYAQISPQGVHWSAPYNLTSSPSPRCLAGYCNSDHWSSLAETIDQNLHLFFVNDKDAGAIALSEGDLTNNPMLYYRFPVDRLDNIEDGVALPQGCFLSQNYPNPFNAQTAIWYTLTTESNVKITIFDLTGRKVAILKDGKEGAGSHAVLWDAKDYASGTYLCNMQTESGTQTRRMTLLK